MPYKLLILVGITPAVPVPGNKQELRNHVEDSFNLKYDTYVAIYVYYVLCDIIKVVVTGNLMLLSIS